MNTFYVMIVKPVSHAFSYLFTGRSTNQPFGKMKEEVGKQSLLCGGID
jgi:hypothetical protein